MNGKIILAGGSGFLGSALADYFAARGTEVVILTRSPKARAGLIREVSPLLLMIPLILTSCGGGGATMTTTGTGTNPPLNGTKPGTYDVVVTATSGPLSHSGTATLVVQ